MSQDALDQYLQITEQIAHALVERRAVYAELRRLHTEARPLHQQLLREMTLGEIDAAFNARCAAILGREARRDTPCT